MKNGTKIAVIGLGNMGKALVQGLLFSKRFSESDLWLSLDKQHNRELAERADLVILAVEPEVIPVVLREIRTVLTKDKIVISVAARVSLDLMEQNLQAGQPLVRVMPNLCAAVGEAISCWMPRNLTTEQTGMVKELLGCFGQECKLNDESLLNNITALSGSGPAYCFYLAELLHEFALSLGCEKDLADQIVKQTIKGAALLLADTNDSPEALRRQVTSKGGTTEKVFAILSEKGFGEIFVAALKQAGRAVPKS